MNLEIQVMADADELAAAAARQIVDIAARSIAARGQFTMALAGGHTPEKTYGLLTRAPLAGTIDWARSWLFFGDERFVPLDDARSNYAMARRALLEAAPIPADHVFPAPTDRATPAASAAKYQRQLAGFFSLPESGPPPIFDLILLGLGDDGHTASLFPGAAALQEKTAWVTSSPPGVLPPPVDRVTFTFPTLNAARHVMFLVSGANKAEAVRDVLDNHAPLERRPAAGVLPEYGTLTWLLDEPAARSLRKR
ncbi:MAG TPA: 6-phosphogluconolactonase [Pirellulales bacterium]|nr:6-phosphogluconolactonase [Pirellulales bacterium]